MKTRTLFTDHPASVGESYGEHLALAGYFGVRMIGAGLACLVHALLPFVFVRTGSAAIVDLHRRMVTHRTPANRNPAGTGDEEAGERPITAFAPRDG